MEARKITVVSTKTQKKSVIMSGAETLGELKKDLREAGIDYDDMAFYEGTSKTELKTDESILPKDVPYTNRSTGETINTNELVFMLTNTNKKIKSGAMTRSEAYAAIKANGLQSAVLARYGKNFTQCSTSDLITVIQDSNTGTTAQEAPVASAPVATPAAPSNEEVGCIDSGARNAIRILTEALYYDEYIDEDTKDAVMAELQGACSNNAPVAATYKPDSASPYSDNEIDAMFRDIC